MSLVSFALRLCVQRLLRGNTWAGTAVLNSPIDPISELLEPASDSQNPRNPPFMIAVYTGERTSKPKGREIGNIESMMDLVIWTYASPATDVVGDSVTVEMRGAGGPMALDLVGRQIERALRFGPAAWRQAFEGLVTRIDESIARPTLVELENGVRIMAVERILKCCVIPEPEYGKPLNPIWNRVKTAMLADAATAPLVPVIQEMIEDDDDMAAWRIEQANRTWSDAATQAMGNAPLAPLNSGEPAEVDDITVDGDVVVSTPDPGP